MINRYFKEGSFSKTGELYLFRKNKQVIQFCCFSNKTCGDTCPLMGEPTPTIKEDGSRSHINIPICNELILNIGKFVDYRGKDNEDEG
jgi:hypothetical protein